MNKLIGDNLFKLMKQDKELADFINFLKPYDPVIYGGFCRDSIKGLSPKDLDIVLMQQGPLRFFEKPFTRNKYGGARYNFNSITVDIWSLEDTKWIKEMQLDPTAENLIEHTNRDENKILYYIYSNLLYGVFK